MGFDGAATFSGDKNKNSKKVERALTSCIVCSLSLSCPSTASVQAVLHQVSSMFTLP